MSKIRVLLVDDHAIFRVAVRTLLAMEEDIEIVGEASDGREAIDKVSQLEPDVVFMDVVMPVMSGLEATRQIREKNPKAKVLILTQYSSRDYILSCLQVGAVGYIPKKATASDLTSAIRAVHQGWFFLHPSTVKVVVNAYLHEADHDLYEHLTNREKEVLKLTAEGRADQEIANLLAIKMKTLVIYLRNAMTKLGVCDRAELMKYAIRMEEVGVLS